MLDTDTLVHFINRKPRFERVARRMSGRSQGELRMSAVTLAELCFGVAKSKNRVIIPHIFALGWRYPWCRFWSRAAITSNRC